MSEKIFTLLAFKKGSRIVQNGDVTRECFYVIHSGKVHLSCNVEIVEGRKSIILGSGNFFSVVSGLCAKTNFETAIAVTDATIISVHKDMFVDFIREYQSNALKIIQYLSDRIKFLGNILDTGKPKKTEHSIVHLYEIAEYYYLQKEYKIAFYVYNRFLNCFQTGDEAEYAKQAERANLMVKKLEKYSEGVRMNFTKKNLYRFYPKGTMLFSEFEPGSELFVIREGVVRITKISNGDEKEIAILQTGDIMGEMSLVESMPRTTNAIAIEDCDVLALVQDDFPQLIKGDPSVAMKISIALSDRIWIMHKKIIDRGNYKTPDR
ncbi:MAG: hypothetical protein Ta2B_06230 [Termitinemataceae bacterium]|nr:MAG: hypothetical protein Ta2B_06230 [Termitinemataceae bacterium]